VSIFIVTTPEFLRSIYLEYAIQIKPYQNIFIPRKANSTSTVSKITERDMNDVRAARAGNVPAHRQQVAREVS